MEKEDILKYLPRRIEEIPRLDEEVKPEGKKVLESLSETLMLISDRINLRVLDAKRINLRLKDRASEISDSHVSGSSSFEMDVQSKFIHYKIKCRDLIKELKELLDENHHLLEVKNLDARLKLTKGLNIAAMPFNPTLAAANQPGGSSAASNHINLPRSVSPDDNETQPVFVPGHQGMFKTKLCNKWQ